MPFGYRSTDYTWRHGTAFHARADDVVFKIYKPQSIAWVSSSPGLNEESLNMMKCFLYSFDMRKFVSPSSAGV